MSYYNAAFDWMFLESPIWMRIVFVVICCVVTLGMATVGCFITDRFNPYLRD